MLISRLGALIGVAPVIAKANFVSMSVDELWEIHEEISKLLEPKLLAEKKMLEQRLISLQPATPDRLKARRPYPPVVPKFANPDKLLSCLKPLRCFEKLVHSRRSFLACTEGPDGHPATTN